ncbi:hypothetical protein QTJ16_002584 [Diplocarpon rosae]|uniref:Karyogamy protein 5 n=1 Tax=Diplocarpon rosae TaxID=946125 RepID=A0AAD9T0N4_9HELO|nr:hypothetical protein QTJ16_002584 [Diplocarpon rosae]
MKLSIAYLLVVLPVNALAWSPFKHTAVLNVAVTGNFDIDDGSKFNPQELLDAYKPEIYTEALIRLKRLESKPICHRVAAQLLMNNCRGLDGINEQAYQLNSDHIQTHQIETFTASLTVCEMEHLGLELDIPNTCSAFSSAALYDYARKHKEKLEVSHQQKDDCIKALSHGKGLGIWLSYRDTAMMFCRAAGLGLEKDQHILLHKVLAQNMAEFSEGVHADLEIIRTKMKSSAQAADSYLKAFFSTANEWTITFQQAFQSASKNAEQKVNSRMNSIAENANAADHMVKQFVKTVIASTAEVSSNQEHALQASTTNIQSQMGDINKMMDITEESLAILGTIISDRLNPMIISLILMAVMNVTDILQGHAHKLDQASRAASDINNELRQAVEHVQFWGDASMLSGSNWLLRGSVPASMVLVGRYAFSTSLRSDTALGASGLVLSEVIIWARRSSVLASCRWGWNLVSSSSHMPSSVTHKAKEVKFVDTTPVQFSSPKISRIEDPRPEMI